MPYGVPAGIAAFGGGLATTSSTGPGNPFNNVFGSVAGGYQPDRSFEKVVQVMELERQLSADRQRREAARKQAQDAAELRQQISPELQELFDVDQKTAIARQFPESPDPTSLQRNLQAGGLQPGTPQFQQAMMQAVNKPQVAIKQEGSIPAGHRAIRDSGGNIVALEAIKGGPADPSRPTMEQRNKLSTAKKTHQQLTDQIGSYAQTLTSGVAVMPGEARDKVKTQRTQIKMQLKNRYELGAITGPDEALLDDLIFDPTSPSSKAYGVLPGTQTAEDRALANLEVLMQEADRALTAAEGNNPKAAPPAGAAAPAIPNIPVEQLQNMSMEELIQLKQVMMNAAQP